MEIKPCAHCGGDAEIRTFESRNGLGGREFLYYIMCDVCECKTSICESSEQAIDVWNSRVEQPSEADRWLAEATAQRARAELAEMQRDGLAEALEAIKRGMVYGGVIQ